MLSWFAAIEAILPLLVFQKEESPLLMLSVGKVP